MSAAPDLNELQRIKGPKAVRARLDAEGTPMVVEVPPSAEGARTMIEAGRAPRDATPIPAGEVLRGMLLVDPRPRLATGLESLDTAHAGGLLLGRLVVVGGAPGAGKTTLATQIAHRGATAGHPVAFVAIDEGPEGVVHRLAQLAGIPRHQIDDLDPVGIERGAERLDAVGPIVVGEDYAGAVAWLDAQGRPGVLVVDSAQTMRLPGTEAMDPRTRVDATIAALKVAARSHLVLVTSELARGAYRARKTADTIDPLAAAKESGGVEYGAETFLVLRSMPAEEGGAVEVVTPKNRRGTRPTFRMRLDGVMFSELEGRGPDESRRTVDTTPADAEQLRRLFALAVDGLRGIKGVRAHVRGAGLALSNDRIDAALAHLEQRGQLERRGTANRPVLFLRGAADA